jgi:hypothetical protein
MPSWSQLSVNFIALIHTVIPYLGGPMGQLKVKEACQSLHFGRISEIKIISKPLLIIGRNIHTLTEYVNH